MTDFGEFLDLKTKEKQDADEVSKREHHERQTALLEERKEKVQPIWDIALPILQRAKEQLEAKGLSLSWSDNVEGVLGREQVEVHICLSQPTKRRHSGYLRPMSSAGVAVLYSAPSHNGPAVSIGNVTGRALNESDVERLLKHLIQKHAGL